MGSTNFRAFATTNTGDNLLSDSEAATLFPVGHQPGIADDRLANKEAKQATLMATALALFIAVRVPESVLDTLTPAELAALFTTAVASLGGVANATTSVRGIAELATNAEVQAGTDAERIVTPAGLASRTATQTRAGIIETATNAEAQAGSSTSHAVTPSALASVTASESRRGLIELATVAEAAAGSDTERGVTPAGLSNALPAMVAALFTQTLANPGTITFPGGFTLKWGSFTTSGGGPAQTFAAPFATACFGVQAIPDGGTDLNLSAVSASGFTCSGAGGQLVRWFAYGH